MSWYWVVLISLAWMALMFIYTYLAYRRFGYAGMVSPMDVRVKFMCLYVALFISWPAVVLSAQLISAAWYSWLIISFDVLCLAFVVPQLSRHIYRPGFIEPGASRGEKAETVFIAVLTVVVAPLGILGMNTG